MTLAFLILWYVIGMVLVYSHWTTKVSTEKDFEFWLMVLICGVEGPIALFNWLL